MCVCPYKCITNHPWRFRPSRIPNWLVQKGDLPSPTSRSSSSLPPQDPDRHHQLPARLHRVRDLRDESEEARDRESLVGGHRVHRVPGGEEALPYGRYRRRVARERRPGVHLPPRRLVLDQQQAHRRTDSRLGRAAGPRGRRRGGVKGGRDQSRLPKSRLKRL